MCFLRIIRMLIQPIEWPIVNSLVRVFLKVRIRFQISQGKSLATDIWVGLGLWQGSEVLCQLFPQLFHLSKLLNLWSYPYLFVGTFILTIASIIGNSSSLSCHRMLQGLNKGFTSLIFSSWLKRNHPRVSPCKDDLKRPGFLQRLRPWIGWFLTIS